MATSTATGFVSSPRFVGFAHSAPRELRDVDDLYDLRAVRPVQLADAYRAAAPAAGLPRRQLQPGRTALLARELGTRAALLALG
ncbi:MAG: hypothetical protein JWQ99_3098 [Blastococcus sp.]|jgi:hypothetical protein|nr:hypothetical protein [Blastococcus sp.]